MMKAIYELTFERRCPMDDTLDKYHAIIEFDRIVKAEEIIEQIKALPDKAFQEELTQTLAFNLRCCVTTIGAHSGVKTTCIAEPASPSAACNHHWVSVGYPIDADDHCSKCGVSRSRYSAYLAATD